MTDLPQLQDALVTAAGRRARRARARRTVLAGVVVLAVVAAGGSALRAAGRDDGSDEVPAATPHARTLDDAFAVFRRPARPEDELRSRLPFVQQAKRTRRVAPGWYLVDTGSDLCLVEQGGGGGCGPIETYLDGRRPIGSFSDERGPGTLAFAFVDGITEVVARLESGKELRLPVRDNFVHARVESRLVNLAFTGPEHGPVEQTFAAAPEPRAEDFYPGLARGGRVTRSAGEGELVLSSGPEGVCAELRSSGRSARACRAKVADVRTGLVLVLRTGDRRLVGAALPRGVDEVELVDRDGTSRTIPIRDNVAGPADARDVEVVRYRNPAGDVQEDRLPASADSAALNGDE